jgi:hypothetical protein
MSNKGKRLQPKFGLDMPFGEALQRFIGTDPAEVDALIKRGKKKKPPGSKRARKPSGGSSQEGSENVVSLRRRRMRKRETGR